ncbi:HD domain-containing protein [Chitinophaga rhizophila]|uniref:HD domain-containing protein n=1 Tax=Chitinophaga rhizophila TaxID=2866212 RepID=A0ABS7GBW9_9BACT|nr:HD domain-containing protein [Chitinophaga rhizophila]MBW8685177.1 HD domain-containing protein [Chitinophaga rhizophila]
MNLSTAETHQLITATEQFVKKELEGAEGGHDWWHIYRVWKLAGTIAAGEQVDMLVVGLSALLHDIADAKFHDGDESAGPRKARAFLESQGAAPAVIQHVVDIIENISFKGGHNSGGFYSPELGVVQDADRLDAIGAIGIARTFNYGGFKNRAMYDPSIPPNLNMTREQYKNSTAPTINHFYEKLLLLKDRMNTATGRRLASERHAFMETFLERFYQEWEGES